MFRGRLRELVEITRPSCDWYTCAKPSIDCEIDHRTERCRQGATDLKTGGPKCRTHHRDKNKGDWQDQPIPENERAPGDPAYREVLVRWFQYGTFSPIMRLHGDREPEPAQDRTGAGIDGVAAQLGPGKGRAVDQLHAGTVEPVDGRVGVLRRGAAGPGLEAGETQ